MKKEEPEKIKIKKKDSFIDNVCIVRGLDLGRSISFQQGKIIEVTKEELEIIGSHRWLEEVKNDSTT